MRIEMRHIIRTLMEAGSMLFALLASCPLGHLN